MSYSKLNKMIKTLIQFNQSYFYVNNNDQKLCSIRIFSKFTLSNNRKEIKETNFNRYEKDYSFISSSISIHSNI